MDVCDELLPDVCATRRRVLLASLLAAVPFVMAGTAAQAGRIDPSQTAITLPPALQWGPWTGLPPPSGEMATLYGGPDEPRPYLVLMKWDAGHFSAPHSYATHRLSLV